MVQPWPLLFIFHCKAFCNNDLQTGHSIETFPHLWQVVFAFRAYLGSREGILGRCHRCFLALQDGEVTIITQTIADTMFLGWSFVGSSAWLTCTRNGARLAGIFFKFQNNLVQTSQDDNVSYTETSHFKIKVSVQWIRSSCTWAKVEEW